MATKNNPGEFDCYANAHPDEPMFVLLGRDPTAAIVVRFWIELRALLAQTEQEKLANAEQCAQELEQWAAKVGKGDQVIIAKNTAWPMLTDDFDHIAKEPSFIDGSNV